MAPSTNSEGIEELRAKLDAAHLAYELAPAGSERAALRAWEVALDAFVAAVLPQEET